MGRTLGELAQRLDGRVQGNPERTVEAIQPLDRATSRDLSFVTRSSYRSDAEQSAAGALLVGERDADLDRDLIVVADPHYALSLLLREFAEVGSPPSGVHETAVVDPTATVDPSASVGPYAVVGANTAIGARAWIEAHVVLGRECVVGADTRLHPRVVAYVRSVLGERCIVHSGAVLGGDGYGFATHAGAHHKLEHLGRTILGDDVEVGANTTIDRGLLGDTIIGSGTKIDNLVMVAHNVQVGKDCLLVAQSGIAGSAELGDGVTVAAQSGIVGHLRIGDGTVVAAKSAVLKRVPEGATVAGVPAIEMRRWRRQQAVAGRLDELWRMVRRLHRKAERDQES